MKQLGFEKTKELLEKYKIPLAKAKVCQTQKQAAEFAQEIGYPLVLKVSSPEILHKTDVGGVEVGIENKRKLREAWIKVSGSVKSQKPKAEIEGILVQEQVPGHFIIMGAKKDHSFGPFLIFGLGGIFVEILKDISVRIAPVGKREAKKMIKEIKGFGILKGFRGREPANIEELARIIVSLSRLFLEQKHIQEVDLNPVIVNKKQALVADAKIIIEL